jgi:UDP-glucuronate 4-epimerase
MNYEKLNKPREQPVHGQCDTPDDPATSLAPYRVFNVDNQHPASLMEFIACIEVALGKKALTLMMPLQADDVPSTCASSLALQRWVDFVPTTPLALGVGRFVDWYRTYYQV